MTDIHSGRRKFLASLGGTAAVTSLAGCSTLNQQSEFQQQLETVREATAKYDGNPELAVEDGYTSPRGAYVAGMGWHFFNREEAQRQAEEGLDPTKPTILNFDTDKNLGAIEWSIPESQIESRDLFADEGAEATEKWDTHDAASHIYASPNGEQNDPSEFTVDDWMTVENWIEVLPPIDGLEAGDEYTSSDWGVFSPASDSSGDEETRIVDFVLTHPPLASLHLWVHKENPNGLFSPINPNFAQQ